MSSPCVYDVLENGEHKGAQKSNEQTTIITNTYDVLKDYEKEYSSSNTKHKKMKKKKKTSEMIQIQKLPSNEEINEKQKYKCDDIENLHTKVAYTYISKMYKCEVCEKYCKSDTALKKHKAKVHVLNGEHLGDEENIFLLNTQVKKKKKKDKKKKKKKKKKKEKDCKERNQVKKLSSNETMIDIQQAKCEELPEVYFENDLVHSNVACNCNTYKCEVSEKSCKSDSALNEHKVKIHKLNEILDEHKSTSNISKCFKDEEYKSLLNRLDKNIKKRKRASKEKTPPVDIEAINCKQKSICDGIDLEVIYNNKIYKCEYCEKSYKSNSSLDKHKAKDHTSKKDANFPMAILKCPEDEDDTLLLNTQVKKMKKDISKDPVTTMTVKEIIRDDHNEYPDNVFNATVHTKESQIHKFYKCDICTKSFEYLFTLNEHKTNCHVSKVSPYICKVCSNLFEYASDLFEHKCINNANSSLECQICNKIYSTRFVLRNHYKVHTGEKPYICDVCSRSFTEKSNLTIHYRQHTGERPYVCDVCGRTFVEKGALTSHYRQHTGERPYVCDICGRTFVNKYTLTCHRRQHTGERPYACDVCGQTFVKKGALTCHCRQHTGERPYTCDICGRTYVNKYTLTCHFRQHTGERPYKCDICDRTFVNKPTLIKHHIQHTGE